ncbi:MAG: hypothetical protein ACT4PL_13795 [Phycisphaerales bacterium]
MQHTPNDAFPACDRPYPACWTVRCGLDAFLAENGYEAAHYDLPRTPARVLGVSFSVPNPPRHRWAIMRHDLHHIATGFGTDLAGEAQLSAWECGRGIGPLGMYVGSIVVSGFLMGLCVVPVRTTRAWRAGRGGRPRSALCGEQGKEERGRTLYDASALGYDALLAMSIGELRSRLGLPDTGIASGRRGLNGLAPREFARTGKKTSAG